MTGPGQIQSDRPCRRCGYNLRGLCNGQVCPECGTSIRSPTSGRFVNNMVDAPLDYLKRLRLGLGMLSLSVVLGVTAGIATFFASEPLLPLVGLVCAPLWAGGTWLLTEGRPMEGNCPPDPILDHRMLRLAIRATQSICLLAATMLFFGLIAERSAATPVGVAPPTHVLWLYGAGVVALLMNVLMLVPFGVYLSALSDWAGHGPVSMQFRVSSIIITLAGGAGLVATVPVILDPWGSGPTAIIAVWAGILSMIAAGYFLVLVLRLANSARWAVSNARSGMERDARVAERRAREGEEMANRMASPTAAPRRHMEHWESEEAIPLAEKLVKPGTRETAS
ncbi:MAG: hypothetical protein DYG94_11180 [Leptolyngbya sp. PLA3]|nr:MAG: hypothetical protein EDM82_10090 [Cyanobacteria bacterium CYA]MCE7969291.1 hypothetical protein [Leptolyngbya sp. PL-A3]